MKKIILRLTPEDEARDIFLREKATDRHIRLAWLLQRSAGVKMDGAEPAPLYLTQAFSLLDKEDLQEEFLQVIKN